MKIDLTDILDFDQSQMLALPVFPTLLGRNLIFGVNFRRIVPEYVNKDYPCYIICYDLTDNSVVWKTKFNSHDLHRVNVGFKRIGDLIFTCTSSEISAIDISSGKIEWSRRCTGSETISVLRDRLFVSIHGHLQELTPETGKELLSIKPRVKWFCQHIIEYQKRFFISTSNSRILELSPKTLNVLNTYKFPGQWSVHVAPIFWDNKMISSSYGSKIVAFDLTENAPLKRFNKEVGSCPLQIDINGKALFYEGNIMNRLTCYDLQTLKKIWSNDIERIQCLRHIDGRLISIFKSANKYVVGIICIVRGSITRQIEQMDEEYSGLFDMDLWTGVGIGCDERHAAFAFEPNALTVRDIAEI